MWKAVDMHTDPPVQCRSLTLFTLRPACASTDPQRQNENRWPGRQPTSRAPPRTEPTRPPRPRRKRPTPPPRSPAPVAAPSGAAGPIPPTTPTKDGWIDHCPLYYADDLGVRHLRVGGPDHRFGALPQGNQRVHPCNGGVSGDDCGVHPAVRGRARRR